MEAHRIEDLVFKNISGCLEASFGGNQVQLGKFAPIRDKVFCLGEKTVIHWCLFTVGRKI